MQRSSTWWNNTSPAANFWSSWRGVSQPDPPPRESPPAPPRPRDQAVRGRPRPVARVASPQRHGGDRPAGPDPRPPHPRPPATAPSTRMRSGRDSAAGSQDTARPSRRCHCLLATDDGHGRRARRSPPDRATARNASTETDATQGSLATAPRACPARRRSSVPRRDPSTPSTASVPVCVAPVTSIRSTSSRAAPGERATAEPTTAIAASRPAARDAVEPSRPAAGSRAPRWRRGRWLGGRSSRADRTSAWVPGPLRAGSKPTRRVSGTSSTPALRANPSVSPASISVRTRPRHALPRRPG